MPVVGTVAYNNARVILNLMRSLLLDGDPLRLSVPVSIQSIARAGNLVTVTLVSGVIPALARGLLLLLAGDNISVQGVADTTYNGTFQIQSVINATQFTYANTGANGTSTGGTVSSIGLGGFTSDGFLLPFLNSAYRGLQRALAMAGQETFTTDNITFVVAAIAAADPSVQVVITDSTAPPNNLPSDVLQPLRLWERRNGSTDLFQEMVDVTSTGGLPSRMQGSSLGLWEWVNDGLAFLGALQDNQVRMRYKKSLPDITDGTGQILIRNSQDAIAYYGAALVAQARGSPLADKWFVAAEASKEALLAAAVRRDQRVPRRRQPFGRRVGYGSRYSWI